MSVHTLAMTINQWVRTNLRNESISEESKLGWTILQELKPFKSNWTKAVNTSGITLTPEELVDLLEELKSMDLKAIGCEAWNATFEALLDNARNVKQQVDVIKATPGKSKIGLGSERTVPTRLFDILGDNGDAEDTALAVKKGIAL